jgi:hypothetical protein
MLGHWGEPGRPPTSRLEQLYKRGRRHTLTQNQGYEFMGPLTYKMFNLCFSIRCGTYNITHTCTQHFPSSVSSSIHHAPFKGKLLLACIALVSPLLVSPQRTDTVLSLLVSPQRTGCLGRTLYGTGTLIPLLGHWGELGGPPTSRLEQPHKRERRHTLTQNHKVWVYGSSYL